MFSRLVLALSFSAVIAITAIAYAGSAVAGVVTKVEPSAVEVRTANCQTETIALNEKTKVIKSFNGEHRLSWPEKVPRWQQDVRVDTRALEVGTSVNIDLRSGPQRLAETVWISAGR